MLVVHNTTNPDSMLKKKLNAIAYHFVRENVAMGTIQIAYKNMKTNLLDCLMKIQAGIEQI
jgi:hypothetical protein